MSYTRSYRETVSSTITISYPRSERGGSVSETVNIPVEVNIRVDTNPFDKSVQHCGANVNLLTAAVVATEAAEIVSKEKNSKKVADSIIGGFFSYIRSEISQQVAELSLNIESQMMHLNELAQSCKAKKDQMEVDFNRIASRYLKIFEDLNHELSNRIFNLDKPAFVFKKETDSSNLRTVGNDLINTVAIFGIESSDLESKICTSIAKKRAYDTITKSKMFLWQQKKLSATISKSAINESVAGSIFVPICFIETSNSGNQIDKAIYSTENLSVLSDKKQKNELIEKFSSNSTKWGNFDKEDQKNVSLYFNTELNTWLAANDQHTGRVREMIQRIAKIPSIKTIN